MADEQTTQAAGTEEHEEEQEQTVTAEQFEELKRQLEETRKAQSGSDRTVAELRKQLEQKEKEAETAEQSAMEKAQERIAEIEQRLQQAEREKQLATQRNIATKLLSDEGLKAPSFLDRLIGDSEEETEAAVKEYIEALNQTKLSAADEFARKNGRKVTDTEQKGWSGMTYKQMAQLSPEEFNKIPSEVVEKAMKSELGEK
jgi:septal ring factor EnvC (AmiA/AmiB activator)